MKRIVSVVLALVVALAMVLGTVSAGSAERLPSLTAAMTYGAEEPGTVRETVSCTARMTEILEGYPKTGGSATGTFVLTAVSPEGIGRLVGKVIYLSVEADGAKKLAYVTVEITQSTFEGSAPYAFVYFDDYGGYNWAFAGEGWSYDEFSSLWQDQSLTENLYGDHGQILINL